MAIFTSLAKDTEVTNPTAGQKGYNSLGRPVYWTGENWVSSGTWSQMQGGPTVEGHTGDDQRQANEWIARFESFGATATWDPATGKYRVTDSQGNKYSSVSPLLILPDVRHAFGLAPTTQNPWKEGADGPGGLPGPLVVTEEYPDGGPMPGGPTGPPEPGATPIFPGGNPYAPYNPVFNDPNNPNNNDPNDPNDPNIPDPGYGSRPDLTQVNRSWSNAQAPTPYSINALAQALANRR